MKRKRTGLTMVEVVVVMAVIVLLVSILVPAILRTHGSSHRPVCRTNLRGIGIALATYQTTYVSYPFIRNGKGMDPTAQLREAMSETEFKALLDKSNTETNIHIIDNLLMLKYTKTLDNWKIFRCPGSPDVGNLMERDENTEYGFYDGRDYYIDYAYHAGYRFQGDAENPARFQDGMESMPILSDQPGLSLKEFKKHFEDEDDSDNDGSRYVSI